MHRRYSVCCKEVDNFTAMIKLHWIWHYKKRTGMVFKCPFKDAFKLSWSLKRQ